MKLYYSITSPYARKVRMQIIELGLSEQVEDIIVNPFEKNMELDEINPLGKVPVLVLDNQESLFNSPLICDYLSSLNTKKTLIPYRDRWYIYRWQALADGMIDVIYNLVMEQLQRPKNEQSPKWINKWIDEIKKVLDYLEQNINQLKSEITLAHLAIASAVGYLDFRLKSILYAKKLNHNKYPNLLKWYHVFSTRECMKATNPK